MKSIQVALPDSLYETLVSQAEREAVSIDHLISSVLAEGTGTTLHTLFQVSTSSALVEGLYQGAVRVQQLLERGDFGLGTFVDLNGEMVVLDGVCYQLEAGGSIASVPAKTLVPYAVVTWFAPDFTHRLSGFASLGALVELCDAFRISDNIFHAFKVSGTFRAVKTRIMRAVQAGTRLDEAADAQAVFSYENLRGTLVGIWSPAFAGPFIVPGYHFHFLSDDRCCGGHVLEC